MELMHQDRFNGVIVNGIHNLQPLLESISNLPMALAMPYIRVYGVGREKGSDEIPYQYEEYYVKFANSLSTSYAKRLEGIANVLFYNNRTATANHHMLQHGMIIPADQLVYAERGRKILVTKKLTPMHDSYINYEEERWEWTLDDMLDGRIGMISVDEIADRKFNNFRKRYNI